MGRILLISQSQDGSYINILAEAAAQQSYSLTVFSGKLTDDIRSDVETIPSVKYDSTSFKGRLKTWIGFIRAAKKYLRTHVQEYDIVMFTSNPPINQSLVHIVQKAKKKCVYLIWDIYPDCIEASFGKKVAPIAMLWRRINAALYEKCDAVLTIGKVMREVLEKSYPQVDIQVIPYHTDTQFIRPIPKEENIFAKKYDLNDKKVFMYSGKMGFGHGFNEILDTAERLKDRDDIVFVFIGFGAAYESLKKHVKEHYLRNTLVLPYQPLEVLPHSLGSATASFITIKESNDGLFLPSKVYDAMASGSAIICISNERNDVARMVEREKLGIVVKPGNPEALTDAVLRITEEEESMKMFQQNARCIAEREYGIKIVIDQYSQLFSRVLNK